MKAKRVSSPAQKRAQERNWKKAQVMSAQNICKQMGYKGRSPKERGCALLAEYWLSQMLENWNNEEHK